MSILIKGMTLDEFTSLDGNIGDFVNDEQLDVIEVLEPHGRLIDENNVIEAIYKRMEELQENPVFKRKHGDVDLLGVKPYIIEIPTVIEAEE